MAPRSDGVGIVEFRSVAIKVRALLFGGLPGIRDLGLIESAVSRPFTGYYRSIESKAAALVQSMSGNHGFIDGNKHAAGGHGVGGGAVGGFGPLAMAASMSVRS